MHLCPYVSGERHTAALRNKTVLTYSSEEYTRAISFRLRLCSAAAAAVRTDGLLLRLNQITAIRVLQHNQVTTLFCFLFLIEL